MDFDFDLEWCLAGARYVTQDEYKEVVANPDNYEAAKKLADHNIFYGYSCEVLNKYCMKELAEYRESIVKRKETEEQNELREKLYTKYTKEIESHPQPKKK